MTVSPNFNDRPQGQSVDMLVLHYTGMESCEAALQRLCDADAGVSAHYLIEEDGTVHRLVDEDKRAWHAGVAWWRGAMDVNGRPIGLEPVHPGHAVGSPPLPGRPPATGSRANADRARGRDRFRPRRSLLRILPDPDGLWGDRFRGGGRGRRWHPKRRAHPAGLHP